MAVMLVLSNQDVETILTMKECMAVFEEMYRDLGQEKALALPRVDNLLPSGQEAAYYSFKHMGGGWPRHRIMALRLNSDIITHPLIEGRPRRVKIPMANGQWVGLIELFCTQTGKLLAIFPDGVAQRMRVGAATGLGIKYFARHDAHRVGLIGSGWQAGAQILALLEVRNVEEVKVFSPGKENRDTFARKMRGVIIRSVESAEECARGEDIILCAISSLVPVIQEDWLHEGMHVSCIMPQEVSKGVLNRCNRILFHTSLQGRQTEKGIENVLSGTVRIPHHYEKGWWNEQGTSYRDFPGLPSFIAGREQGRTNSREITCFINNIGLGLQFVALGVLSLEKAERLGLGKQLPPEWFSESVHP